MKTKTIYHLDYDCNIVRVEVITKDKSNKKRPVIMNIERLFGKVNVINTKEDDAFEKLENRIREKRLRCRKNLDEILKNSEVLWQASFCKGKKV